MDNKKKNNLILSAVGLLLIIGGVFYYKKEKQTVLPKESDDVVSGEEVAQTPEDEANKEQVLQDKVNKTNEEELKAQNAAKKAAWSTAMDNARTAFGKGEYDKAISFYKESLNYYKRDSAYSGLFLAYSAQNNVDQARIAIDAAINLNPTFSEHWKSKLSLLNDKTNLSFTDLKKIYEDGLTKVNSATKINLVTFFAVIAENKKEYKEAIAAWEYAKTLYPQNSSVYQAEIERLQKI